MKTNSRGAVYQAVEDLSAAVKPGGFFSHWHSAGAIAKKAGVSVSTARKHLKNINHFRGYAIHRFPGGALGYKYYGDAR